MMLKRLFPPVLPQTYYNMPSLYSLLYLFLQAQRGCGSTARTEGSEASGETCRLQPLDGSARSAGQKADGNPQPRWRGAAPYLLTPSSLPPPPSPVPAHHLRALRVRAIDVHNLQAGLARTVRTHGP
jgi:hypothetical protein